MSLRINGGSTCLQFNPGMRASTWRPRRSPRFSRRATNLDCRRESSSGFSGLLSRWSRKSVCWLMPGGSIMSRQAGNVSRFSSANQPASVYLYRGDDRDFIHQRFNVFCFSHFGFIKHRDNNSLSELLTKRHCHQRSGLNTPLQVGGYGVVVCLMDLGNVDRHPGKIRHEDSLYYDW